MKKIFISLLMAITAFTTVQSNANAKGTEKTKDPVSVRFVENTIVIQAKGMTGATLYTEDGTYVEESNGKRVKFEVEKGQYLVCAHVGEETIVRWIIVR